jgi:hypothetical protein
MRRQSVRKPATARCRATALRAADDERPLRTTPSATWLSIHTKTLEPRCRRPARCSTSRAIRNSSTLICSTRDHDRRRLTTHGRLAGETNQGASWRAATTAPPDGHASEANTNSWKGRAQFAANNGSTASSETNSRRTDGHTVTAAAPRDKACWWKW